ncbi:MAG: ABC transporter permease [Gammaproteobacteria bacterium]|nr:MAG: ABC transporter permease [Gammaproteobacteria bacterium]
MVSRVSRDMLRGVSDFGYLIALLGESFYWPVFGPRRKQPVRIEAVFTQMMQIGVEAIPILAVLTMAVGIMLAIQLVNTLELFGVESQVVLAVAKAMTREFGALMTAILLAGRSGSALAARIGSMVVSQEIEALRVMGIDPVRYLVVPAVIAFAIMTPALVVLADAMGIIGGGLFSTGPLNMTMETYIRTSIEVLTVGDVMQGLSKGLVFGILIALVGCSAGFSVRGGAEGVGRATTRAVVLSLTYVIIVDMMFTWFMNV